MVMTRDELLSQMDFEAIEEAIRKAELQTSGEICVSISHYFWGDVSAVAEKAFTRLRVSQTKRRNGVLIFVVPSRRKFVVLGDQGIHEKVGTEFWQGIVAIMAEQFKLGNFTEGIINAIQHIGHQLAEYFPREDSDENELPNKVDVI